MSEAMTELLERAVEAVSAPDDLAADVIHRVRLKRRLTLAASATVLVVVAATGGVLLSSASASRSVISAATPSPSGAATPSVTVLDSVNGIDVTWLPAGLVAYRNRGFVKELGHLTISQYYQPSPAHRIPNVTPREIDLSVQRGYTEDLQALVTGPGSQGRAMTVRGHQGVLLTYGPVNPGEGNRYVLTWVEAPGLTLSLSAEAGVTVPELQLTAAGLVVHPTPAGPADPEAATAAVRAAVMGAFTGGQSAAATLSSITNGQQLAPVLAELEATNSEIARSARVSLQSVAFLDPEEAVASIKISYASGGVTQGLGENETVALEQGAWRVSQDSYCQTVITLVPSCPAR